MSSDTKRNIVLLLFVTCVAMAMYLYKANLSYETDIEKFKEFRSKSSALVQLQKKWKNQKANQKKFNQITKLIKPSKQTKSKGVYILTYENLSSTNVKRVGKFLLNSHLNIKELKLEKSAQSTRLHVEIIL
jgi:hypothetical protein